MKIYAFRVQQNGRRGLGQLLELVNNADLNDRHYMGERFMRLEAAFSRDGFWYADFAAPRNGHGPGRMGRGAPIEGIQLEEGHSFGEDTAFAFDPQTGYLAVQYNHYGPRSIGIEKYLYSADVSFGEAQRVDGVAEQELFGFRFGAVLKPDAYARLRRWGIYKSIEFCVSVPGAQAADLDAGRSLTSILNTPLPDGVETITIGLQARPSRDGSLGDDGIRGWLNDLERLGQAVKSAVVRGKPTAEDRSEAVNLVTDRISHEVDLPLGVGARYDRQARWNVLGETLRNWIDTGRVPRVEQ